MMFYTALESKPSWFTQEWDIEGERVSTEADFERLGRVNLSPPFVGYVWEPEPHMQHPIEPYEAILNALRRIGPVFLWQLGGLPTAGEPLLGRSSFESARRKIWERIELPNWPAWYWAALPIGEDQVRDTMITLFLESIVTFLVTDRQNRWPAPAYQIANELNVKKRVKKDWDLRTKLFDTIARLVQEDELLLGAYAPVYWQTVWAIYGRQQSVEQFMDNLAQMTPTERIETSDVYGWISDHRDW